MSNTEKPKKINSWSILLGIIVISINFIVLSNGYVYLLNTYLSDYKFEIVFLSFSIVLAEYLVNKKLDKKKITYFNAIPYFTFFLIGMSLLGACLNNIFSAIAPICFLYVLFIEQKKIYQDLPSLIKKKQIEYNP